MLITCSYCGPRDVSEFTYQGEADRPAPKLGSTDMAAWNTYVYGRANPAGDHREHWQHSGGCRAHLLVTRSTVTHRISDVRPVRGAAT
jgi:methylglutamate dehydrogenase subunit B